MPLYTESGIEFTFPEASAVVKHDAINAVWPGVDFIIDAPFLESSIWLEVKNWEPFDLAPRRRSGVRRSYKAKMKSASFFNETLRGKFLGTSAFYYHTATLRSKPIIYAALIESPLVDGVTLLQATVKLNQALQTNKAIWTPPITALVVNIEEWNKRYTEFHAVPI